MNFLINKYECVCICACVGVCPFFYFCMSYFTMNQDAQIFNDNQECLNDQYLNSQLPEHHTKKDENEHNSNNLNTSFHIINDSHTATKAAAAAAAAGKKESLNWAHPCFTMSQFQLYETKTVNYYVL